ncbi:MAG: putative transporter [Paludibacteraceae bacterium]|nr:putative transporter [Paludibacteraceae bacterium]
MQWLHDLLFGDSVAHAVLLYSFIITLGVLLGKIKIAGVSLGVTFVLFVGIAVGHFGFTINPTILGFVKEFGLILFIYSIGLQVGPSFFSTFRKGGMALNGIAILQVVLGLAVTIAFYFLLHKEVPMAMLVGTLSGAVTNTPGLGAAEEALRQLNYSGDPIGLGYAVAYPMGVVGMLAVMIGLRYFGRVDLKKEEERLSAASEDKTAGPEQFTLRVENKAMDGLTLQECKNLIARPFVVSRLMVDGTIRVPADDTLLHVGDTIRVVAQKTDIKAINAMIGSSVEMEWKEDESKMVSRRIVITRDSMNGRTISQLQLRSAFGVNITRVNRSGIDLLARPDLALQVGDRVMVVGPLDAIAKVETIMGNTLKRLNYPHLTTIFLGIFMGILLGALPVTLPGMPMPAKLGLAGGPLIVALLVGRFGYKIHLITYTTQSANLMLRELGISLFLASVGLSAGGKFVDTLVSGDGLLLMGVGVVMTVVPLIIVAVVGRLMKTNYFTLIGVMAGASTNPPGLAYSSSLTNGDAPAVAYSTVYPLTMFLRIITAQFLVLWFPA